MIKKKYSCHKIFKGFKDSLPLSIMWRLLAYTLLIHLTLPAYSQNNVLKNLKFRADDFFNAELYNLALTTYKQADSIKPNDAEMNYKMGLCYLNLPHKSMALKPLLSAQKLGFQSSGLLFNLGKAYHFNNQFSQAYSAFDLAKKIIFDSLTQGKERHSQILRLMQNCKNGMALKLDSQTVKIKNLGAAINSKYPDYAPLLNANETKIIFTSCRLGSLGNKKDLKTGNYFEDIWMALRSDSTPWQVASNMGSPVNTQGHDATASLSADGQTLIIYRNENLYISYLKGTVWTEPILFPKTINTEAWESSASLSADGMRLYFSSNKKGGKGGKDIYVSNKNSKGLWEQAINLGSPINTAFDEESPFIHPNQKTLYFSSDRTESIGGFDIFYSNMDTINVFTSPINIGFPINSAEDELDFVWSADGKRGYFSSIREGGFGEEDIYMLEREVTRASVILLSGKILDKISFKPITAQIIITDLQSQKVICSLLSNEADGKYTAVIPADRNYSVNISASDYLPFSENIFIGDSAKYLEYKRDYLLQRIEAGNSTALRNVFFDTNKSDLRPESSIELNSIIKFLQNNNTTNIQINGHTDNVGSEEYNMKLSLARAQSVQGYFLKNGISKTRLSAMGMGSSVPIATNESQEGRQLNRRIEIVVKK